MKREDGDSTFGAALLAIALVGGAFALGAGAMYGGRSALSVLFGTALALANLYVLGRVIRAMLPTSEAADPPSAESGAVPTPEAPAKRGSAAAWGIFAVLKVLVLFGLVFVSVNSGWVSLLGFLLGYGALPIGIVMAQLARGMSAR